MGFAGGEPGGGAVAAVGENGEGGVGDRTAVLLGLLGNGVEGMLENARMVASDSGLDGEVDPCLPAASGT